MPLYFFDLLLLYVVSVSSVSMVLLVMSAFKSLYALILGSVVFLIAFKTSGRKFEPRDDRMRWGLLVILLIALFFRHAPYLWTQGGQDQGLYVNLSAHMERQGGLTGTDEIRNHLTEQQKVLYDKYNSIDEGPYHQRHTGVLIADAEKSRYLFKWYPLHPAWMAIFAKVFGSDNRAYSLVFFSIISIVMFYLLALELSGGSRFAAYVVAGLLTINPLHVFFSKFPMTEMVFLAFSVSAIYYLLRYYASAKTGGADPFYLFLSLGAVACLSFTRFTLVLYFPLFYLLHIATVLYVADETHKRHLNAYFYSFLAIFAISGVYYYFLMRLIFITTLGFPLMTAIIAFWVLSVLCVARWGKGVRLKSLLQRVSRHRVSLLYLAFLVAGLLSVYDVMSIATTRNIKGLHLLAATPLVWYVEHLAFIGLPVFAYSCYHFVKKGSILLTFLIFFVFTSLCFYLVNIPSIAVDVPYQYYHARFLLPEVIPYSLLVVALFLDVVKERKRQVFAVIGAMGFFYLTFSAFLIFAREEPDRAFLKNMTESVKESDLIVAQSNDKMAVTSYFITPLVYYCNLNVFVLPDLTTLYEENNRSLWERYDNIFVLSSEALPEGQAMRFVKKLSYAVRIIRSDVPPAGHRLDSIPRLLFSILPTKVFSQERDYYLYRLANTPIIAEPTGLPGPRAVSARELHIGDMGQNVLNKWDDGWTNGDLLIKNVGINIDSRRDRRLVVHVSAFTPLGESYAKCRVDAYVNGKKLRYHHQEGASFFYELDPAIATIKEINVKSCSFIPQVMGINSDQRTLGVGIDFIKIAGELSKNGH